MIWYDMIIWEDIYCVYTKEFLVYTQEISCACATLLCMLWARDPRGQGPKKGAVRGLHFYYIASINDFNIFDCHNITLLLYHNILLSHCPILKLTYSVIMILHYCYFIIIYYYHLIQLLLLLLQPGSILTTKANIFQKNTVFSIHTHSFLGDPVFCWDKSPCGRRQA